MSSMAFSRFFFGMAGALAAIGTLWLLAVIFGFGFGLSIVHMAGIAISFGGAFLAGIIGIICYFGARAWRDPT